METNNECPKVLVMSSWYFQVCLFVRHLRSIVDLVIVKETFRLRLFLV